MIYNPSSELHQAVATLILGVYVLAVVYGTKYVYNYMVKRGLPHNVAVYYNRKIIHMLGGGVVALLTPWMFTSPVYPFLASLALAVFLWWHRRSGKFMFWFQTPENSYEVNFTIAWGLGTAVLWLITGNPMIAVVPALFIAFGDAVTGVIRNAVFGRRTKHWYGNVGMALVTMLLGYAYAGWIGVIAGLVSSFVERFEFPPIDDNILIALSSALILLAGSM